MIRQPPYASSVIFELHKSVNSSEYYIQVYSKNNTAYEEIKFKPMQIYGCDELCPLSRFNEIIKDKTVEDFNSVCKRRNSVLALSSATLTMTASFVAFIGMGLSACAIQAYRSSRVGPPAYVRQQL
jgi:hypothetical protein